MAARCYVWWFKAVPMSGSVTVVARNDFTLGVRAWCRKRSESRPVPMSGSVTVVASNAFKDRGKGSRGNGHRLVVQGNADAEKHDCGSRQGYWFCRKGWWQGVARGAYRRRRVAPIEQTRALHAGVRLGCAGGGEAGVKSGSADNEKVVCG